MRYLVRVALVLESNQHGAYENGTVLRCVQAAFPSASDINALLPAGVKCTAVDVRMTEEDYHVEASFDGPSAKNFPRPMGALPQGDGHD